MRKLIGWIMEVPEALGPLTTALLKKYREKMALKRWQEEKGMRQAKLLI